MSKEVFQIIEENEFFIVIFKPEGLSVHNQAPSVSELLTAAKKPLHFVNRLDLETSGLMVIAQKPEWHEPLSAALENGKKFYRALLRSPYKSTNLAPNWNWSISDKAEGYKNPQGMSKDRVSAETRVKIKRSNQYFTEAEFELITGRQHQIRKHAAIAKHPIVGDPRYNEEKYNRNIEKFYGSKRMLLQAEKIEFSFSSREYIFEKKFNLDSYFNN